MFDFIPPEYEKLVNIIFLVVTALIARHGITYRKEDGERDFVRLLFGCIAATYFFLVLFKDVLGLISFYSFPGLCMTWPASNSSMVKTLTSSGSWSCSLRYKALSFTDDDLNL